jgi:DNA-3-methyladenine glycosylase
MEKTLPNISAAFFARNADLVARELIGMDLKLGSAGGTIVETESYHGDDPASHSYPMRQTPRNAAMFGPPAHAYVYRSYGIHWCLNFVCLVGSAVLIRALVPEHGIAVMARRRGTDNIKLLCSGPGRLCQALGVTGTLDGASLLQAPFVLRAKPGPVDIVAGPRIGIAKATHFHRRFGLKGSGFLSKRFAEK